MRFARSTRLAAIALTALVAWATIGVGTAEAQQDRRRGGDRDVRTRDHRGQDADERRRGDRRGDVRTRDHRGQDPSERARGARRDRNMCVRDVPATFAAIPAKVKRKQYLGARNDVIGGRHYTSNVVNSSIDLTTWNYKKWLNYGAEHFQGIQRKDRYLYITGGRKYSNPQMGQLIVVEMGSRPAQGPWSIPEYPRNHMSPDPADRIVKVVDLDERVWHAGGIQRDGDVLAVGMFGHGDSQVRFYDISRSTRPSEIEDARIERELKSNAVGLTTLEDGRRLLVVWNDEYFDFYRSKSADPSEGFGPRFARIHRSEVEGGVKPGGCPDVGDFITKEHVGPCGTFQNVQLVTECDGDTYLLGFRNTNKNLLGKGGDYAGLYEIEWPGETDRKPVIRLVDKKHMFCQGPCNFGGGAGIYRTGSAFFIYGVAPYLHDGSSRVNFNEYALGSPARDHRDTADRRTVRDARSRSDARDQRGRRGDRDRGNVRDHRDP